MLYLRHWFLHPYYGDRKSTPGGSCENLLLETGFDLLLETGTDALCLE